jgi:hypothetical protein
MIERSTEATPDWLERHEPHPEFAGPIGDGTDHSRHL